MSGIRKTLLAVAAFVAFMIASFIWFVATWDASKEQPISHDTSVERSFA